MIENMSNTEVFALFTGLYCVAAGVGLALDWKSYKNLLDELQEFSLVGFLTGLITFMIGALIVSFHNIWTNPIAIIVSLIGWAALIEGLLLLAFRRTFVSVFSGFPMTAKTLIPYGIFAILLGVFLIYGAVG